MADDTATRIKEATSEMEQQKAQKPQKHQAFDVMVATFADRTAAQKAYKELKALEKRGEVDLESALVLDRDSGGRTRVSNATLPAWVWAVAAAAVSFGIAAIGLAAFGIGRGVMGRMQQQN